MKPRQTRIGLLTTAALSAIALPALAIEDEHLIFFARSADTGEYGAFEVARGDGPLGFDPMPIALPGDMFFPGDLFNENEVGFGNTLDFTRQDNVLQSGPLPIYNIAGGTVNEFLVRPSGETEIGNTFDYDTLGGDLIPGGMFLPGDMFDIVNISDQAYPQTDVFQPGRPLGVFVDDASSQVAIIEIAGFGSGELSPSVLSLFSILPGSTIGGVCPAPEDFSDQFGTNNRLLAILEEHKGGAGATLHLIDASDGTAFTRSLPAAAVGMRPLTAGADGQLWGFKQTAEGIAPVSIFRSGAVGTQNEINPANFLPGDMFTPESLLSARSGLSFFALTEGDPGPPMILLFALNDEPDQTGVLCAYNAQNQSADRLLINEGVFENPIDIAFINVEPSEPEPDCPADVNDDGVADPADFTAWLACFNNPMAAPYCFRADVNGSGFVDPADFTAWLAAFNAGCP